jgi:hypothetical protein
MCITSLSYLDLAGWDSVVGIVAHYRLQGLGMKSWQGQDLPHLSRLALGPTQPPIQWVMSHSWW